MLALGDPAILGGPGRHFTLIPRAIAPVSRLAPDLNLTESRLWSGKCEERATVGPSSVSLGRLQEDVTLLPDFPTIAERPLLYLNKYEYQGYDEYGKCSRVHRIPFDH